MISLARKLPMPIKNFLKDSIAQVKSLGNYTTFNTVEKFPLYAPYGYGSYNEKSKLTIQAINNIFYNLKYFHGNLNNTNNKLKKFIINNNKKKIKSLEYLFNFYKSDKAKHKYHHLYATILKNNLKNKICEIGLGTNNPKIISTMGKYGKPGASLRAFREFLPKSLIYGLDIDKKILFSEQRIKTFYLDQLNISSYKKLNRLLPNNLDLVIDDGLHSIDSSLLTLKFFLKKIKVNGYICIEDIPETSLIFWEFVNQILSKNFKNFIFKGTNSYIFICKRVR
jgi:hypothetical protein